MRPLALAALLHLAPALAAQGINVDLGDNLILFPAPGPGYGAAAGQTGAWNAAPYPYQAVPLVGLDGSLTDVTLDAPGAGGYNNFMTSLTGDDERLMEDQLFVPNLGTVITVRFEGLEPGTYQVYTYGWDESGAATVIDVVDAAEGPQTVGGIWAGSPHVQGVTYSLHTVGTLDGVIEIEAQGPGFNDAGGLNGVQLVPVDGGLGTSYCTAALNSTGSSALVSALGSASVAANLVRLEAGPVPTQPGLFYYGPSQVLVPFGDGFRCVGGVVGRLDVTLPVAGQLVHDLDLTQPPSPATQITPGSTWNFQAWYRDPAAGGSGFNLSDGLQIAFVP